MVANSITRQRILARDNFLKWHNHTTESFNRNDSDVSTIPRCVAPFYRDEVTLGRLLCSDGITDTFEIRKFNMRSDPGENITKEERNEREKVANSFCSASNGKYVVKRMRRGLELSSDFQEAVTKAAIEYSLLSFLVHPNIIQIHGVHASKHDAFLGGSDNFFVILEQIDETLDQKIDNWLERKPKNSASLRNAVRFTRKNIPNIFSTRSVISEDQIEICSKLASVLNFIHESGVAFRDLKPANIGFDYRGNLKLFNFGLARTLNIVGEDTSETFGSYFSSRYSSPEVLSCKSHDNKADVYSFGCVLWAVLSYQHPFSEYGREKFIEAVTLNGENPRLNPKWPCSIRFSLQKTFSTDSSERPSMREVLKTLQEWSNQNGCRDTALCYDPIIIVNS